MLLVTSLYILQDTVVYILTNSEGLTSSQICGIILQGYGCSRGQLHLQWSVNVDPGPKPEINTANSSEANVRASTCTTFPTAAHFHSCCFQLISKCTPLNITTENNTINVKYIAYEHDKASERRKCCMEFRCPSTCHESTQGCGGIAPLSLNFGTTL